MTKPGFAAWCLLLTGLGVHAAGWAGLLSGDPWVRTWFYVLAWGSYLLVADGLNRLRAGRSLLFDEPRLFAGLAALSVPWWLLFEALNFRLGNWAYEGVPEGFLERRLGTALAFATVLPGLWETRSLLDSLFAGRRGPRFRLTGELLSASIALGALFLALPLLRPRWFYPAVWGFVFLLLEPWLAANRRSWLFELSEGRPGPLLSWLAAGLVCGGLWEAWNWGAGGRWVYTLPDAVGPKLFEMPLLGYLGFLPFALESASAAEAARLAWGRAPGKARLAAAGLLAGLSLAVLDRMDLWTVRSFAP